MFSKTKAEKKSWKNISYLQELNLQYTKHHSTKMSRMNAKDSNNKLMNIHMVNQRQGAFPIFHSLGLN